MSATAKTRLTKLIGRIDSSTNERIRSTNVPTWVATPKSTFRGEHDDGHPEADAGQERQDQRRHPAGIER